MLEMKASRSDPECQELCPQIVGHEVVLYVPGVILVKAAFENFQKVKVCYGGFSGRTRWDE